MHNRINRNTKRRLSICEDLNSPKRRVVLRRLRWTDPEKNIMNQEFADNIRNKKLPSRSDCLKVLVRHEVLKERNVDTIYAWINNRIKKNIEIFK